MNINKGDDSKDIIDQGDLIKVIVTRKLGSLIELVMPPSGVDIERLATPEATSLPAAPPPPPFGVSAIFASGVLHLDQR